jgi:hypothetical protein
MCNVTLRCVCTTIVAVEKQKLLHIPRVCFVALSMPYAMCMRHIVILWLYSWTMFFHFISSRHYFRKNVIERKMCVLISWKFVRNISHSKKKWANYDKKYTFAFMYTTRYSCEILMKFGSFRQILEIYAYQISWKSLRWEPSYSEDRREDKQTDWLTFWLTDMTKLIAFRNFANAPKKKKENKKGSCSMHV